MKSDLSSEKISEFIYKIGNHFINIKEGTVSSKRSVSGGHDMDGYVTFNSRGVSYRLHRVIWALVYNNGILPPFKNENGEALVVKHLDNNKENNKPSNLKLDTNKNNIQDAIKDGLYDEFLTMARSEQHKIDSGIHLKGLWEQEWFKENHSKRLSQTNKENWKNKEYRELQSSKISERNVKVTKENIVKVHNLINKKIKLKQIAKDLGLCYWTVINMKMGRHKYYNKIIGELNEQV